MNAALPLLQGETLSKRGLGRNHAGRLKDSWLRALPSTAIFRFELPSFCGLLSIFALGHCDPLQKEYLLAMEK